MLVFCFDMISRIESSFIYVSYCRCFLQYILKFLLLSLYLYAYVLVFVILTSVVDHVKICTQVLSMLGKSLFVFVFIVVVRVVIQKYTTYYMLPVQDAWKSLPCKNIISPITAN